MLLTGKTKLTPDPAELGPGDNVSIIWGGEVTMSPERGTGTMDDWRESSVGGTGRLGVSAGGSDGDPENGGEPTSPPAAAISARLADKEAHGVGLLESVV